MDVVGLYLCGGGVATCRGVSLLNTVVELLRMFIKFLYITLVLRMVPMIIMVHYICMTLLGLQYYVLCSTLTYRVSKSCVWSFCKFGKMKFGGKYYSIKRWQLRCLKSTGGTFLLEYFFRGVRIWKHANFVWLLIAIDPGHPPGSHLTMQQSLL